MRRSTDIDPRSAAIERLVRAGRAAMPNPSTIAEQHLGSMSVAGASQQGREGRAPARSSRGIPRRRLVLVGAMAAFIAVPALAMAGALPDPVQRIASKAAGAVGVDVPLPSNEQSSTRSNAGGRSDAHRSDSGEARTSDSGTGSTGSAGSPGSTSGAVTTPDDDRGHVNGTKPGKPEDGEQRGNRFGQVPGGPDQGTAGQPHGNQSKPARPTKPPKPVIPKPAKDPKADTPTPATPAPATPAPATPAPATPTPGGNGNGNGN